MINVSLTQRAQQQRFAIGSYLWKNLPAGTDDEVQAAIRLVKAEWAKVDRAVDSCGGFLRAGQSRLE
jgi:hypothetical protein